MPVPILRHLLKHAMGPLVTFGLVACSLDVADPPGDAPAPERAARSASGRERQPVEPAVDPRTANLLQQYVRRDPIAPTEPGLWALPFQSKRAVVALFIIAAQDRLEDLPLVLSPDARWGLPDTRELGAQPVFAGDGGEAFFRAFRRAASRFPAASRWQMQPLMPGVQEMIRTGAEPMWSYYAVGPDRLVFRQVVRDGRAVIDYVGLFEELPTEPFEVRNQGAPPPLTPPIRLPDGRVVSPQPRRVDAPQSAGE